MEGLPWQVPSPFCTSVSSSLKSSLPYGILIRIRRVTRSAVLRTVLHALLEWRDDGMRMAFDSF